MNSSSSPKNSIPGDVPIEDSVQRAIRVDHAGEYGAVRIYEGQLWVLKNSPNAEKIRHMATQEKEHLVIFENLILKHKVRPTLLSPFWNIAGFAMGAGTALLGENAAMACTEAVEEVIDKHYSNQISMLKDEEPELCDVLSRCQKDEREHQQTATDSGAKNAVGYTFINTVVKGATKTAIWLSERV